MRPWAVGIVDMLVLLTVVALAMPFLMGAALVISALFHHGWCGATLLVSCRFPLTRAWRKYGDRRALDRWACTAAAAVLVVDWVLKVCCVPTLQLIALADRPPLPANGRR